MDGKTQIVGESGSHPAWDAWIEIGGASDVGGYYKSHPAWDAWIEM